MTPLRCSKVTLCARRRFTAVNLRWQTVYLHRIRQVHDQQHDGGLAARANPAVGGWHPAF
jgi:hypothetical protein